MHWNALFKIMWYMCDMILPEMETKNTKYELLYESINIIQIHVIFLKYYRRISLIAGCTRYNSM